MASNEIVFITGNVNKLNEVRMLLANDGAQKPSFTIRNMNLDLEEVQGANLEEIALTKCKEAVQKLPTGQAVFVEDTALCFDEFNGLPGAYIKWFVKSMGVEKVAQMLNGFENRGAKAVTTVVYADNKGEFHTFQGITAGTIVNTPRGSRTFGWDCIFQPNEGSGETYAEMAKEQKNLISQRGRAFAKLKMHLQGKS
ncbi:LAMI_0G02982g1_1 [Lachancea mirantina]|uniref:Inosine triphosphate pyrophosphatase n=1 Tax=Lachancea mirantina TaxID=1230905 RepID=A0A1G4K7Z2_9SACH|nr:LAMI_0G02982g1_1 [Lachancea mirantina]